MQRAADAAAATSTVLTGAAWFGELEPYFAVGALAVAIISGALAAWYHFEKALFTRKQRKGLK